MFLLRLLNRAGLLRRNWSTQATVAGREFRIPVQHGLALGFRNEAEPWLIAALRTALALTDGTVVDVGVNLGQTMLKVLSLRSSEARRYVGFEPNPQSFAYAETLARLNADSGVSLVPVGLSDRDAVLSLRFTSDTDPAASLVQGFRPDAEYRHQRFAAVFVGAPLLDALDIPPMGVLKIDVEGAEADVLIGLEPRLVTDRPIILCEVLPVYDEATKQGHLRRTRTDRLEALLARLDYRLFRLHHDGRVEPIARIETHGEVSLSDYAFVPAEQADAFLSTLRSVNY